MKKGKALLIALLGITAASTALAQTAAETALTNMHTEADGFLTAAQPYVIGLVVGAFSLKLAPKAGSLIMRAIGRL